MTNERSDITSLPPSRRRFIATALAVISGAVAAILGIPLAGFFALPALRRLGTHIAGTAPISGSNRSASSRSYYRALGTRWPRFEGNEMVDLITYIGSAAQPQAPKEKR